MKRPQAVPQSFECTMKILSARGDTQVCWNPVKATIGDSDAIAAVKEAQRIFDQARAQGATVFDISRPKSPARKIEEFDPNVREMIVVPRVAGGAL